MPLTLHVLGDNEAKGITVHSDRTTIGRAASCDLVLADDASVHERHATLRRWEREWVFIDEIGGGDVGGVPLSKGTPRIVRPGDEILIGRTRLELREEFTVPLPPAETTREVVLNAVAVAMRGHGVPLAPTLRVVEGPDLGATLELDALEKPYVVGRSTSCDLVLADTDVSRAHVRVVRSARSSLAITDLDSASGTLLGRTKVPAGMEVKWRHGTMLRIGNTVLTYDRAAEEQVGRITDALIAARSGSAVAAADSQEDDPTPSAQAPREVQADADAPNGSHAHADVDAPALSAPMAPVPEKKDATIVEPRPKGRGGKSLGVTIAVVVLAVFAVFCIVLLVWIFAAST